MGFLKELRRANVAFTRAKSQLVLTGDLSTLMRADDPGFRTLIGDLHQHLLERGDLRDYWEVMAVLDETVPDPRDAAGRTRKGGRP
ncbi:AAA domain-containing protein [Streptomyces sp. RKAG290]|uniref:AAA domain-containing protein n=1 Tax=Streptomyces sp. RKAG290 TaxID=2888348 RepID=UPI0035A95B9C